MLMTSFGNYRNLKVKRHSLYMKLNFWLGLIYTDHKVFGGTGPSGCAV